MRLLVLFEADFFAGAFLAVVLLAVDLLADFFAAVDLLAEVLLAVDLAVDFFAAVDLLAVDFAGEDFLAAVDLAVDFFAAVDLLAVDLAGEDFFAAVDLLAVDLLVDFFAAVDLLAVDDFFAVDREPVAFLAAAAPVDAAADAACRAGAVAFLARSPAFGSFGSFLAPETTFFRSAPAVNFGMAVFLALMRSPVRGLRTHRDSRTRFSNEPNPVIATFSPRATSRVITSSTDSSACCACFRFPS